MVYHSAVLTRSLLYSPLMATNKTLKIFLTAFLILFLELTLIRWLGIQVRALSYFPNLILISAFLGLGVGSLTVNRGNRYLALLPLSILLIVVLATSLSQVVFTHNSASEHLWLLYYDLGPDAIVIENLLIPIGVFFVASALVFSVLGKVLAQLLNEFRAENRLLAGYCWDITGSITGVVGFSLMSFLWTPSWWWFVVVFALMGLIVERTKVSLVTLISSAILTVVLVFGSQKGDLYSPYYALNYEQVTEDVVSISTNGSLHQIALNFSDEAAEKNEKIKLARDGYMHPYEQLNFVPERALVLGAGSGNDVQTLLLRGVKKIDAVEIDPGIIEYGKKYHPASPYDSSYVTVINDDARSYLEKTEKQYDLIVFGTLDSQTKLSALSNVRLDNYVYTIECLESAKKLLTPRGGIVMLFMASQQFILDRLVKLHSVTFEQLPVVYFKHHRLFNLAIMSGQRFHI